MAEQRKSLTGVRDAAEEEARLWAWWGYAPRPTPFFPSWRRGIVGQFLRWVASPSPQHNPLDGLKRDGE
jgi:hypothetical protein